VEAKGSSLSGSGGGGGCWLLPLAAASDGCRLEARKAGRQAAGEGQRREMMKWCGCGAVRLAGLGAPETATVKARGGWAAVRLARWARGAPGPPGGQTLLSAGWSGWVHLRGGASAEWGWGGLTALREEEGREAGPS